MHLLLLLTLALAASASVLRAAPPIPSQYSFGLFVVFRACNTVGFIIIRDVGVARNFQYYIIQFDH